MNDRMALLVAIQIVWAGVAIIVVWKLHRRKFLRLRGGKGFSGSTVGVGLGRTLLAAIVVWLGVPFFYVAVSQHQEAISARRLMVMGIVAYLGVLGVWIIASRVYGQRIGGFTLRRRDWIAGIGYGLVGGIVVIPLIFWVGVLIEQLYKLVAYEHPRAHEALELLLNEPYYAQGLTLLSILVLAPLVEEVIFRGLLQTLIRQFLMHLKLGGHNDGLIASGLDQSQIVADERRSHGVMRYQWAAIVLTSIAFAGVHETWSMPPIFVFSLCLGYVFERTGNLWSAITLHALFNGVSTAQFLLIMR